MESEMDLADPVHEDSPHLFIYVDLLHHVVRRSPKVVLSLAQVLNDGDTVLSNLLRVIFVCLINLVDVLDFHLIHSDGPKSVQAIGNITGSVIAIVHGLALRDLNLT